jgi:hypothetical protein
MDYIHTWLNKWRMQGNFTKEQGDGISPKEGECQQRAGKGPPERLDTRRHH